MCMTLFLVFFSSDAKIHLFVYCFRFFKIFIYLTALNLNCATQALGFIKNLERGFIVSHTSLLSPGTFSG